MLKLYIFLIIPLYSFADFSYTEDGKKIYSAVTKTVKSSNNIVYSATSSLKLKVPVTGEKIVSPQERELFLKQQFTSKNELLNVQEVKKENISVNQEIIEFFNSLNNHVEKPINIE